MPMNLAEDHLFTWEAQAAQYPPTGPAGVSYFRGEEEDVFPGKWVDCLLYRTKTDLVGILNYYDFDFPPYEEKGTVNIWISNQGETNHVRHRSLEIVNALTAEAEVRWGPVQWEFDILGTHATGSLKKRHA